MGNNQGHSGDSTVKTSLDSENVPPEAASRYNEAVDRFVDELGAIARDLPGDHLLLEADLTATVVTLDGEIHEQRHDSKTKATALPECVAAKVRQACPTCSALPGFPCRDHETNTPVPDHPDRPTPMGRAAAEAAGGGAQ